MTPRVQCPASCHSVLALRCLGEEHKSGQSYPQMTLTRFHLEAPTPWLLLGLRPSTWQTWKLPKFWDHPRLGSPSIVPPWEFTPIAKLQCG